MDLINNSGNEYDFIQTYLYIQTSRSFFLAHSKATNNMAMPKQLNRTGPIHTLQLYYKYKNRFTHFWSNSRIKNIIFVLKF